MIAVLAFALFAGPDQAPAAPEIFSKMLTKYYEAKSVRGTVLFSQTAMGAKVDVATTLQKDQPNLFYIEQTRIPKSSDSEAVNYFMAASDGKKMVYTMPAAFLPATGPAGRRLYETAPPTAEAALNIFCTMLADRSLPIGLSLYNAYEVQLVTDRFSNLRIESADAELGGRPCYKLRIDYTRYFAKPKTGQPAIKIPAYVYIDKDFNLLGLWWEEAVGDKAHEPVVVRSEWKVNLQTNVETNKDLYVIR
jgi:hypothetical protein